MIAPNLAGTWQTDHGQLELHIDGSRVTGTYGLNAGRIVGTMVGNVIQGTWRQTAPCLFGTTWGSFVMTFSADGRSFTARWHYMDQYAPGWGNWYGKR